MKHRLTTHEEHGLVAILDALGATKFRRGEVDQFLKARETVIRLLHEKADDLLGNESRLSEAKVSIFTFNDTIIITFRSGKKPPNLRTTCAFLLVVRKFVVDSLANGILFRGAVGAGTFRINEATNTVMGEAVSDAAAWYEEAQWVGVHCTPRCSITIDAQLQRENKTKTPIMLDYDVPLKGGATCCVKAVNWPRVFLLPNLNPWHSKDKPKARLLRLLARNTIPFGVEDKYHNTIRFFDHCMDAMAEGATETTTTV